MLPRRPRRIQSFAVIDCQRVFSLRDHMTKLDPGERSRLLEGPGPRNQSKLYVCRQPVIFAGKLFGNRLVLSGSSDPSTAPKPGGVARNTSFFLEHCKCTSLCEDTCRSQTHLHDPGRKSYWPWWLLGMRASAWRKEAMSHDHRKRGSQQRYSSLAAGCHNQR